MSFLVWIVFGAVVGVVAKLLMPGRDPGGFFMTIILGIAGALLGGFLGRALGLYREGGSCRLRDGARRRDDSSRRVPSNRAWASAQRLTSTPPQLSLAWRRGRELDPASYDLRRLHHGEQRDRVEVSHHGMPQVQDRHPGEEGSQDGQGGPPKRPDRRHQDSCPRRCPSGG